MHRMDRKRQGFCCFLMFGLLACLSVITSQSATAAPRSAFAEVTSPLANLPANTPTNPPARFTKVAAGYDHTCALTVDGAIYCWGDNADGQVGDGSDFPSRPPSPVMALGGAVVDMVTGGNHSCALQSAGSLFCWGRNSQGQLGDGTTDERLTPVPISGLPGVVLALTAGDSHTCALIQGGSVACWGGNDQGQLGDGSRARKLVPTLVNGLNAPVVEIVAGFAHTCARLTDRNVRCWGDNAHGQLGNGTQTDSAVPVAVSGLTRPAIALAAGFDHTCAALEDGDVECWGNNARGQLGDGTRNEQLLPVAVQDLSDDIAQVTAGRYHTCALAIDGDVHCWGSSSRGQLGAGSLESSRRPVRVSTLGEDALAVAAGEEHSCALLKSQVIRCWGSNRDRQLGEGAPGLHTVPQLIIPNRTSGALTAVSGSPLIVPGRYHTCLLTVTRGVQCWGRNSDGQLGDGTEVPRTTPIDVVGLSSGFVGLALGAEHSCALRQTGAVLCWGSNQYGQLGDGTTDQRSTPVDVNGLLGNAAALVAGDNYTCALMQGGTVKCWGQNRAGQLGDGTTADSSFPVAALGLNGATALAAGVGHTCALAQGTVNCWGENSNGQLGDGTTASRTAPGTVTGLPSGAVTALAAGDNHTCATVDGAVYCWGSNRDGQLGNGTEINQATPVAVPGITGAVRQLGAGASHSCGLTTDDALYCWGGNEQSQLGDGSTADRSTAALVSGLSAHVLSLHAGGYHNCVLVTTNRPLCWGNDSDGQLASGILAQSTVPLGLGDAPPPRIDLNSLSGQPGSTFTLIGSGFAANAVLPVVVNDVPLTMTIPVNPSGEFIVYVASDNSAGGSYVVTIGDTPALQQVILLQPNSPLQRAEGDGLTLLLPSEIGRPLTTLYLPIVARSGTFAAGH